MAHLNCPTVSKVSRCLGCLALETARQSGQMRHFVLLLFLIHLCNAPSECCPFIKTFSYICRVRRFLPSDITYCESVFRKSFSENVEVFLIIRAERNNTHFRIDTCGRSRSAYPYPISIRVWGIVSSIYDQGLSTTFRKINESQLHTFFVYMSSKLLSMRY